MTYLGFIRQDGRSQNLLCEAFTLSFCVVLHIFSIKIVKRPDLIVPVAVFSSKLHRNAIDYPVNRRY